MGEDHKAFGSWQPFISKTFGAFQHSADPRKESTQLNRVGAWIRNKEIYSLAIVLLELAFNASLQSKRIESDVQDAVGAGIQAALIDYATARRLTDRDLIYEMGLEYANAVRRCLYGFDVDTHDLDSENSTLLCVKGC